MGVQPAYYATGMVSGVNKRRQGGKVLKGISE